MDLLLKLDHLHIFTFNGILLNTKEKLPTSIRTIFNLARGCSSCKELESKLYDCNKERAALNRKQVVKLVFGISRTVIFIVISCKFVLMKSNDDIFPL